MPEQLFRIKKDAKAPKRKMLEIAYGKKIDIETYQKYVDEFESVKKEESYGSVASSPVSGQIYSEKEEEDYGKIDMSDREPTARPFVLFSYFKKKGNGAIKVPEGCLEIYNPEEDLPVLLPEETTPEAIIIGPSEEEMIETTPVEDEHDVDWD